MSDPREHDVKHVAEPKEYFERNYWVCGNELVIIGQYNVRYNNHVVRERYEGYDIVYRGTYKECVKYCENRYNEYLESLF